MTAATVIGLVALRLVIGWHFFKEGAKKWVDPAFTSAPFLLEAKGPLAPRIRVFVSDGHDWRTLLAQPLPRPAAPENTVGNSKAAPAVAEDKPYQEWAQRILRDWQAVRDEFATRYRFDAQQASAADAALQARTDQLLTYLDDQEQAIADYRYALYRAASMQASPLAGHVPYQDKRIADKRAEAASMPQPWVRQVEALDDDLENDLRHLLTAAQSQQPAPAGPLTPLGAINKLVTYWVLAVGVCLVIGLLTRTAAVAGAVFLLAVIATQPPWVVGAQPVYYQTVEMIALLVLATTAVGRWGGLDFFVHALVAGRRDQQGESS